MVSEEEEDAAAELPSSPILNMQSRALVRMNTKRQRGLNHEVKHEPVSPAVTNESNFFSNRPLNSRHFTAANIQKSTHPDPRELNCLSSNPYAPSSFYSNPFQTPQRKAPIEGEARKWSEACAQYPGFEQNIHEQPSSSYGNPFEDPARTATQLETVPTGSQQGSVAMHIERPSGGPQDGANTPQYTRNFPSIPVQCLLPSPGHVYDNSPSSPPLTYDQMMALLDNSFPLNADNEFGASGF